MLIDCCGHPWLHMEAPRDGPTSESGRHAASGMMNCSFFSSVECEIALDIYFSGYGCLTDCCQCS